MGRGAAHSNICIYILIYVYIYIYTIFIFLLQCPTWASLPIRHTPVLGGIREKTTGERMRLHFTTKIPNRKHGTMKTIPIDERWSLFFNQVKLTTSPIFVYFTCRSQQFVLLFAVFQVALKMCFLGGVFNLPRWRLSVEPSCACSRSWEDDDAADSSAFFAGKWLHPISGSN